MKPILDLIPDYLLGALDAEEHRRIDALVASSPDLQREVDRVTEALAATATEVAPLPPPASLRSRLRPCKFLPGCVRKRCGHLKFRTRAPRRARADHPR